MAGKRIILAYSGGLDTTCILRWLTLQGQEVVAYVADVGQVEDLAQVAANARRFGAVDVVIRQLQREMVTDYVLPAIAGNAVYEGRYLLGTALARPVIVKHQVQVAAACGAHAVAHGATGKGNDQVRFEFGYAALAPHLQVISPWKDPAFLQTFQGRADLIRFAQAQQLDIPVTLEKPFSTDENIMHKSYESGVLEDPMQRPPADMCTVCCELEATPDQEEIIDLDFADGVPVLLHNRSTGEQHSEPLALFSCLNALGARHGVGRLDLVENRFIGIKSRGIYETPGGTILHAAQRDLEGIAMDPQVQRLRDMLAPRLAETIYNGFWFSPEMRVMLAALRASLVGLTGLVRLQIFRGHARPIGRSSPRRLYDRSLASMDVAGGFNQADAAGFIRLHGLRLRAQAEGLDKL